MNTNTGQLYSEEQMKDLQKIFGIEELSMMQKVGHATPAQISKMKIGRNDICPCGKGKKFKKCCLTTLIIR